MAQAQFAEEVEAVNLSEVEVEQDQVEVDVVTQHAARLYNGLHARHLHRFIQIANDIPHR